MLNSSNLTVRWYIAIRTANSSVSQLGIVEEKLLMEALGAESADLGPWHGRCEDVLERRGTWPLGRSTRTRGCRHGSLVS